MSRRTATTLRVGLAAGWCLLTTALLTAGDASAPPRPLWCSPTEGQVASTVALRGGVLVVTAGPYLEFGSPHRFILGLDSATGRIRWKLDAGKEKMPETPTVVGNHIFWVIDAKTRWVVDALTGARLPARPRAANPENPGTNDTGRHFLIKGNNLLCTTEAGDILWSRTFEGVPGQPASDRGTLLVSVSKIRALFCLAPTDGRTLWRINVPSVRDVKEPELVNFTYLTEPGRVYVANYDGQVMAWAVDGPEPPYTLVLMVNPSDLVHDAGKGWLYTPNSTVRQASYTRYRFPESEFIQVCGEKTPEQPFRLIVTVVETASERYTPPDPTMQAPEGGFSFTTHQCRLLGLIVATRPGE